MRHINPNLDQNNVPIIRFVLACLVAGCILISPHRVIIHHPAPGHSPLQIIMIIIIIPCHVSRPLPEFEGIM